MSSIDVKAMAESMKKAKKCAEGNSERKVATSPVGYESLIPVGIFQRVVEINKQVEALNLEVAQWSIDIVSKGARLDEYQQMQVVTFLNIMKDLLHDSELASNIHEVDKPFIDECAKEHGVTTKQLVHNYIMSCALAKIVR